MTTIIKRKIVNTPVIERKLGIQGADGISGTDTDALHKSTASEISAIAEKATPVSADLIVIEDSADSHNKKRVQVGNLPAAAGSNDKVGIDSGATANYIGADSSDGVLRTDSSLDYADGGDYVTLSLNSTLKTNYDNAATHTGLTNNPHSTDIGNLGSGTLAELNAVVTDATLDGSSDTRTPASHNSSHQLGGADAIKLDDLATPDDNTNLDSTTGQHGLLPKLGGGTTNFLRADGTWATPPGAGGGESNTASSAGSGTSIYYQKSGVDLQFNAIKSENAYFSVALDGATHDIELTANVGTSVNTLAAGDDSRFLTSVQKTDLTDAGDSTLHYHASDRSRANHTGTQTAATISDFDTEVSNNTDVTANTSARHSESHTIASHSDTTGTGAELNTLTDGSNADSLHVHTVTAVTDIGSWAGSASLTTVGTLSGGNADAIVTDATDTAKGKVELATIAETSTGTDATRAVTPDGLAGSDFGERAFCVVPFESDTDTATGDGKVGFCVPSSMANMDIVYCVASVHTAGTTGTTDIQIRRRRSGSDADVLSTKLTIDSGETSSTTAATPYAINTSNDDLSEGDLIYFDIDSISTTAAKGLSITIGCKIP